MATGGGSLYPSSTSSKACKYHELNGEVVVVVDGRRFTVNKSLFTKHPNTMLGRLVYIYRPYYTIL